jgi:hypothetical protein
VKDARGYGSVAVPLEQRFFAKVDVGTSPAGCWIWTANRTKDGYGTIQSGPQTRRMLRAHRVAYEMLVGTIPDGAEVDHLCREPSCVNPLHLEVVSRLENLARGRRACGHGHETHCPHGHPYDEVNTYVAKDGSRRCRTCRTDGMRRAHARRKDARA